MIGSCRLSICYWIGFIVNMDMLNEEYEAKWMQIYRQVLCAYSASSHSHQVNLGDNTLTVGFGQRQQYHRKQVGQFIVVRNVALAGKRQSKTIQTAHNSRTIDLPFDSDAFNFNKINSREVISVMGMQDKADKLVINGAPICRLHSLFLPFAESNRPQFLTGQSMRAVISLMEYYPGWKQAYPRWKIAYNSQGAASTVNHLHFHFINTAYLIQRDRFPIESSPGQSIIMNNQSEIQLQWFQKHAALYLKITCSSIAQQQEEIIDMIDQLVEIALVKRMPHNLIVLDDTTVMFIYRNYATSSTSFGYIEYCEVILAKSIQQYDLINKESIDHKFQEIGLTKLQLQQLRKAIDKMITSYRQKQ